MKTSIRLLSYALTVSVFMGSAYGQGAGKIVGTVTDPSGGLIPSATVTVKQSATGQERTTVTNTQGYYVVPSLPPSQY